MSGDDDDDILDILGPEPEADTGGASDKLPPDEVLLDETPTPKSRPMGAASRALVERSRSYPINRAAKKNTPERLQRLLDYIAEMPVTANAALRANVSVATIKFWLQKSKEGAPGDGFDIALGMDDETENEDNSIRFHDAWDAAMEIGVGLVESATIGRAQGFNEIQVHKGRVQYKIDPDKYSLYVLLGDPIDVTNNPDLWLRDERGIPIPETVWKMDPDLAIFILKTRKPLVYGQKAQLDVNVRGGVLVVSAQVKNPADLNTIEEQYRREGMPTITFDEDEDGTE
jgi:hypothetical protein